MFRTLGHQPGIAQALNIIGEIARVGGNDSAAWHAYEECIAVCCQTGESRRICNLCRNMAHLAQHAGDYKRAMHFGRQGLQRARGRQDRRDMAEAVITVAGCLDAGATLPAAQLQKSARLLGAAEAALERIGAFQQPSDTPEYAHVVANVRDHLDDTALHRAWAEGRTLTLEQAVDYALEGVIDGSMTIAIDTSISNSKR